ncbi:energy transducer TonB [Motiliproteus coralliicola]|uniref:Energy transducer TonB n=1 Tax=Motiliproteus coralliicola TaxID=2283196 RepID=A0A369WA74_9GAMM|nr:energy transducer TonB [Motiliproteus coralliicola]RDE18908.1 energy transducer TonB [Motiliproteus coralliicola]
MSQSTPVLNGPRVGPNDRLGFTLFVAVAIHALIVLGVGFEDEQPTPVAKTLEVTLAQFRSDLAPEKADFIAQHNQIGSGEQQEKALPTTKELAPFQNNQSEAIAPGVAPSPLELIRAPQPQSVNQPTPEPQPSQTPSLNQAQPEQLSTQADSRKVQSSSVPPPPQAADEATGVSSSLLARSLEIASLEAKLDSLRQERADSPRIRRLTSASTREAFDAQYLDAWRAKVERVGNLNYPEEARQRKLYGHLRLLVVIRPDGSLDRVEVLKSSGYRVLDDSARRIVRLAAPYDSFGPELRKHADRVEIIRTWKFERARIGIRQ